MAVEEEFAILDPETLGLVNRFEELQAAAEGTPLEEHLVGELIASEIEVRTGRCETFAEAAAAMAERRRQLLELAGRFDVVARRHRARTRGAPGRSSASSTRRTTGATTRSSATSSGATTASGCTSTSASAAPTARSASPTACAPTSRTCSPTRAARRSWRASSPTSTRRARRSSRACSRAAASRTRSEAGHEYERYVRFLYDTGSITEHTQIWWSVRPHLAFPTVEIRICDGQPELGEAQALAALMYALAARIARAVDEGEPLPEHPHRLLEENLWRAIRHGLSGELIDLDTGEVRPARAEIERLIEWMLPVAEELGVAAVPGRAGGERLAERQIARYEAGETLAEIYAQETAGARPCLSTSPERAGAGGGRARARRGAAQAPGRGRAREHARPRLRRSATGASGSPRTRATSATSTRAALAIETMQALVPVLEDFLPGELVAGFEEQIANLQLAYAKAVQETGVTPTS